MARPRLKLDWDVISKLCALHCTQEEIAHLSKCCLDTLDNHSREDHGVSFSEFYAQNRSVGRVSLRRKQLEVAMKGDRTMLVWLGKQMLGQSEKVEQQATVTVKREHKDVPDEELTQFLVGLDEDSE